MAFLALGSTRQSVPYWRGYKTTQQTITASTYTAVSTFVERESGGGSWTYPTGGTPNTYWSVPKNGLYHINFELSLVSSTPAAGEIVQSFLAIDVESGHDETNDEFYARTERMLLSASDTTSISTSSTCLNLTTANKLYLIVWSNAGGTLQVPDGTDVYRRMDVTLHYIGA